MKIMDKETVLQIYGCADIEKVATPTPSFMFACCSLLDHVPQYYNIIAIIIIFNILYNNFDIIIVSFLKISDKIIYQISDIL